MKKFILVLFFILLPVICYAQPIGGGGIQGGGSGTGIPTGTSCIAARDASGDATCLSTLSGVSIIDSSTNVRTCWDGSGNLKPCTQETDGSGNYTATAQQLYWGTWYNNFGSNGADGSLNIQQASPNMSFKYLVVTDSSPALVSVSCASTNIYLVSSSGTETGPFKNIKANGVAGNEVVGWTISRKVGATRLYYWKIKAIQGTWTGS